VFKRSAGLFLLWLIGCVAVPAWSLTHVISGTVTPEKWARRLMRLLLARTPPPPAATP
jgi:hypothetical protein